MYEEMGREIPVPAIREAQGHSSRGITAELEFNKPAVTKTGGFHNRASYEGNCSNRPSLPLLTVSCSIKSKKSLRDYPEALFYRLI